MRTAGQVLCKRVVKSVQLPKQIRKLERWLGTPQFVRTVRRLRPTAEALSYWEQVKPALRQLETANLAARGLREGWYV